MVNNNSDKNINNEIISHAVGRRKRSVARVRMYKGNGKIIINGKPLEDLKLNLAQLNAFLKPLNLSGLRDDYDFTIKVVGGGKTGQVEATRHGISRCIAKLNEDLRKLMRSNGFLTRDPREKERKKIYRVGARRSPQFSKR